METIEQDTHPVTVYSDWNGYWWKHGHIDMDCKHTKIIILRWLPWSGKSTWAKSQDIPSISKDDIRQLLHNGIYSKANERATLRYRDEFIITQIMKWNDVIVDDTNLNPIHIANLKEIAIELVAEVEIKDFHTDVETCIERDSKRENPVGEKVIRGMAKKWNYPPVNPEFEPIATFSSEKVNAVVFDIDWTLAKNVSRNQYDMSRVLEDEVYSDIAWLVRLFSNNGYTILFVSWRDTSCMEDTQRWLDNKINTPIGSWLLMRAEWDKRKDSIVKYEILKELNKTFNIRYIFDDRDRVVKMAREAGFRCLQVQDGNF